MPAQAVLVLLGFVTAAIGALGGLGGAAVLVPALVLLGADPLAAAPLGLLTVAAGSLAAGERQLRSWLVHNRLGILTELAATAGAFAGAIASTFVAAPLLTRFLGVIVSTAGLAGTLRRGTGEVPLGEFAAESPGEWPGTLSGAYRDRAGVVPYTARRLGAGIGVMGAAGLVAGLVGIGGGVLKTPAQTEVMGIPVKVAAATSTFTVGITAAAALIAFAAQGRVDVEAGAAVVLGALVGGHAGALVQDRLGAAAVRRIVGLLVLGVGVTLLVRG